MDRYQFTSDWSGFKADDVVDAVSETNKFIVTNVSGKAKLIDKKYLKKLSPVSTVAIQSEQSLLDSLFASFEDNSPTPINIPEPETQAVEKPALAPNEFWLTDVTNGRLPDSGIDYRMSSYPDTTFPQDTLSDIPAVDPNYWWDANVLEALWLSHKLNKRILLAGFPGTGKTTAVAQFGAWIKQPVMRFNGKDGVDPSSFLGNIWANAGGMEWKDGLLPQGLKLGYLVTIDEVFKIPAGIQMAMQNLYEDGGCLVLDDKPGTLEEKKVIPANTFRLFLTDNVKGTGDNFDKFSATQVQDSSTLDRFGITCNVNYLPATEEISMLSKKFPGVNQIDKLVKFAGMVRELYAKGEVSITVSPRGLQTVCEVLGEGVGIEHALRMTILNKFSDGPERDAVFEAYRMCF